MKALRSRVLDLSAAGAHRHLRAPAQHYWSLCGLHYSENRLCLAVWVSVSFVNRPHDSQTLRLPAYLLATVQKNTGYFCPQNGTLNAWIPAAASELWLLRLLKWGPLQAFSKDRLFLLVLPDLWQMRPRLRTLGLLEQRTLGLLEWGRYCQPISTPTWTGVGPSPGLPALCTMTNFSLPLPLESGSGHYYLLGLTRQLEDVPGEESFFGKDVSLFWLDPWA